MQARDASSARAGEAHRRIADVDVLLGAAIIFVLAQHLPVVTTGAQASDQGGGSTYFGLSFGVDLLLAIAGYLGARELLPRLGEASGHGARLRAAASFWRRCARRFLPSAWLWLLAILACSVVFNRSGAFGAPRASLDGAVAAFFGAENFVIALRSPPAGAGAMQPYWAVSLLAQVCLVLPLLAALFGRRLWPVLAAAVLLQLFLRRPPDDLLALVRTDALLLGVLVAVWARGRTYRLFEPTRLSAWPAGKVLAPGLGVVLLAAISSQLRIVPFALGVVAVLSAVLVWLASYDRGFILPAGAAPKRFLAWLGRRAYSLYLAHVPAYLAAREIWFRMDRGSLTAQPPHQLRFIVTGTALALALAELNYLLVEGRLRRRGEGSAGRASEAQSGEAAEAAAASSPACGVCDGRDGDLVRGWAWLPAVPEVHVIVEQRVDGLLAAETVADLFRGDLMAAGVGHACYGWEMRLALDPSKVGPQTVELRVKGGERLVDGGFAVTCDAALADTAAAEGAVQDGVEGRCDGLKGSALYGWAWNPSKPDEPVEVGLWIDGACVTTVAADGERPDLRNSRIGHGRCGWRLPIDLDAAPSRIEVRAGNGQLLTDGVIDVEAVFAPEKRASAAVRAFVDSVLRPAARAPSAPAPRAETFLLYVPEPEQAGKFWAREYDDYRAAAAAFAPVLGRLGEAVVVDSLEAANLVCAERRAQGRDCILLSFAPPRRAPLQAGCPVVPVFSWAFPALPTGAWDGDFRSDWRNVLRASGRAITFSRFAADAVRAAMGADFPVATIFPPARAATAGPALSPPAWRRKITLDGVVFDSRSFVFSPEKRTLPVQLWDGRSAADTLRDVEIEGVLVTAFLDFKDGRKNWGDLVSAFVTANRDNADAVLLLKLSEPDGAWPQALYRWLAAHPRFACRILATRGRLEGKAYDRLIAATHWYATACNAEGLCLPMQDFLAAGRPAVAPDHTALADHVDATNALIVASEEEAWDWPLGLAEGGWSWTQHPDDVGPTTRRRVSWTSLEAALREAHRLAATAPADYAGLCAAAAERARAAGGVEMAALALADLLARGAERTPPGPAAAPLLREPATR